MTKVRCNVIECEIGFEEPELEVFQDSLALKFAKSFWQCSINSDVDTLYLRLENRCLVDFCIAKSDLSRDFKVIKLKKGKPNYIYEILNKDYVTKYSGKSTTKILEIEVLVKEDIEEIEDLFRIIKDKYKDLIQGEIVSGISIDVIVSDPLCRLCISKKYKHFINLSHLAPGGEPNKKI